jgi:hypothetical protein
MDSPTLEKWPQLLKATNSEAEERMQKNTFTNWINHQLEAVGFFVLTFKCEAILLSILLAFFLWPNSRGFI